LNRHILRLFEAKMKRILVLYKELAGYFIACLDELCQKHNVEADVIAYPVHADAPFQFKHSSRIRIISRNTVSDVELCRMAADSNYNLIFTGGWFDKGYLKALRGRKAPALLGFDNAWHGSIKQQASALYGRLFIRPLFEYAFVPGSKQRAFALHLGFNENQIISGAYSCDVSRFSTVQLQAQTKKRLVYAGRYSPEKFIEPLFQAFHELASTRFPDWELHCIGTGPIWEARMQSPHIVHHGFMQPDDLLSFMPTGSAYILPSTFEPWGVAAHEFAAAGYPLILSNAVGAAEAFLEDGVNGYLFNSAQQDAMKAAMAKLMLHSQSELTAMGAKSREMAMHITPTTWANDLARIMS
jgi:glycosyltransferase involved in cell wall biosynthesis